MTDAVARLNAALSGRYRVERELGEGGMATVYLADDLKHERKVDHVRYLALLWCCALPLVAAACGGRSPTEGTAVVRERMAMVPLTDMRASTYFGFPGGLYPGGNVMPQAHADAGQAFAAAIEPLDLNGNPDPDGKYVLLSIGHSNTEEVFCANGPLTYFLCPSFSFTGQALADPDVDTNLAIVRGGCCGGEAELMQDAGDPDYNRLLERLSIEGLSEQQVQVVWAQLANAAPMTLPHRDAANLMVRWMGNVMRTFRSRYPNLRLVFFTSDVFGGYAHREPVIYENGFAMKWLIQAQIDQVASGGTIVDERAGDLNYNTAVPWIGWGPYLWADGVNPRSDGLSWPQADYGDRAHLGPQGVEKAAGLLLTFFKTSPQARC